MFASFSRKRLALLPFFHCKRALQSIRARPQSSFRIVPMPRFLVNSELLLLPNRSR